LEHSDGLLCFVIRQTTANYFVQAWWTPLVHAMLDCWARDDVSGEGLNLAIRNAMMSVPHQLCSS
jgi:hypothetical protein